MRPPGARRARHQPLLAVVLLPLVLGGVLVGLRSRSEPAATAPTITAASGTAPAGSAPAGISPAGTAPVGTSPAGTAPAGTAASGTAASGTATPDAGAGSTARSTGSPATGSPVAALGRSVPVGLRIPALNLAVPLSRLGLNRDGTVEVPTDFGKAGWFRLGPTPGQVGSAVILGHVDSYRGPAVFYRLGSLRTGDRIEVTRADGALARFRVSAVETYLKDDFPARRVYASHGYSALHLVTCGGAFDARTRSYLSNVVVYATLVGTAAPPRR